MKIDILKIITKCSDFSGQEVVLNSSEKNGIITFTFEWNELEGVIYTKNSIELNFSVWNIKTSFPDTLDDVLISDFKFEYQNRFM